MYGDKRLAQLSVGHMYAEGGNVSKDPILAYKWLALAANGNITYAKSDNDERDYLALQMSPKQIAEAKRMAAEWRPVKSLATDLTQQCE